MAPIEEWPELPEGQLHAGCHWGLVDGCELLVASSLLGGWLVSSGWGGG